MLTNERKQLLEGAEQVHKFVLDASETNDRMNEKVCKNLSVFSFYLLLLLYYYLQCLHN